MLFSDISSLWLECRQNAIKESTFARYRNALKTHLLPTFGMSPVTEINEWSANDFVRKELLRFSPKTVADVLNIFRSVLKFAKRREPGFIPPEICGPKLRMPEAKCLDKNAQLSLEKFLLRDIDLQKLGVLLCLYTGLRIGELCALRRGDISLAENRIRVERTLSRVQSAGLTKKTHLVLSEPKTEHSRRAVPVPGAIAGLLARYAQMDGSAFLLTGNDRFMEPRQMQNFFRRCQQECGVTPVKFHALRHTFATRCVELGFEIKSLSEILGHSNVRITLDKYVHASWHLKCENMDKLQLSVA